MLRVIVDTAEAKTLTELIFLTGNSVIASIKTSLAEVTASIYSLKRFEIENNKIIKKSVALEILQEKQ